MLHAQRVGVHVSLEGEAVAANSCSGMSLSGPSTSGVPASWVQAQTTGGPSQCCETQNVGDVAVTCLLCAAFCPFPLHQHCHQGESGGGLRPLTAVQVPCQQGCCVVLPKRPPCVLFLVAVLGCEASYGTQIDRQTPVAARRPARGPARGVGKEAPDAHLTGLEAARGCPQVLHCPVPLYPRSY